MLVRADGSCISSHTMQHVSWGATHELGFAEFDYHSLRHTHATMLAEKGARRTFAYIRKLLKEEGMKKGSDAEKQKRRR